MFHAHVSEFAELGWMGFFNAVNEADYPAALAEAGLDEEWDFKSLNSSTVPQAGSSYMTETTQNPTPATTPQWAIWRRLALGTRATGFTGRRFNLSGGHWRRVDRACRSSG